MGWEARTTRAVLRHGNGSGPVAQLAANVKRLPRIALARAKMAIVKHQGGHAGPREALGAYAASRCSRTRVKP